MLSIKQIGIIAAQSAMAGAAGFALLAYSTKTGFGVSRLATGSLGALIFGGNLAVYYAVGTFGEARGMAEWKVRLLQAGAMGLYDIALFTTCVALGVMAPASAMFASFMCLGCFAVTPGILGNYQRQVNPDRIYKNAIPPSVFSLPPSLPLQRTEEEFNAYAAQMEFLGIQLQLNFLRALREPLRREALERYLSLHPNLPRDFITRYVNHEINPRGDEVNLRHRPEINVKLGRCLLHHMKEAKALLLKPETPGIRHYTQEDIANAEGDSFWSITVMGIYSMIANSVCEEDKRLFTIKGTGEEQLFLGPDQDVLELRDKMIKLHKSTQTLSDEAKTLLTLKLTRADTKLEEAAAEKVNDSKQLEQMQQVFNAITTLKGELDRHLISSYGFAPEPTLDWNQVFV